MFPKTIILLAVVGVALAGFRFHGNVDTNNNGGSHVNNIGPGRAKRSVDAFNQGGVVGGFRGNVDTNNNGGSHVNNIGVGRIQRSVDALNRGGSHQTTLGGGKFKGNVDTNNNGGVHTNNIF